MSCQVHGVHVRGRPAGAEQTVALRPADQPTHGPENLALHQDEDGGHLIGEPAVTEPQVGVFTPQHIYTRFFFFLLINPNTFSTITAFHYLTAFPTSN